MEPLEGNDPTRGGFPSIFQGVDAFGQPRIGRLVDDKSKRLFELLGDLTLDGEHQAFSF